ncbi:TspO/MBR family protein [Anaerotignum sp. MB30-C6]|uniref:TspO/MBR family protein n=1 Tax=Anaerotignum sp. MB30-C6 TaxID=3070814 RepID=UPI0027DBAC78|nr:TspO/MBR family protein [Anaerotignum sp. MB30-C6]WMI81442.1 TspO/MBR family protein [Anaerotignum sp. MB30-C6]
MCNKKVSGLFFILLSLGVGGLSGFLNMGAMSQYQTLNQPPLAPPAWVFPVVWTILYILMGIGAAIVYCSDSPKRKEALKTFFIQLVFNFCWSFFFFTLEWRFFAFVWLIVLLLLVLAMVKDFNEVSTVAARLQIPYVIWLCFAAYLNFGTWWLNR